MSVAGCSDCLCQSCLMWWSNRCPYGGCFDDHRAKVNPYDVAHPNKMSRPSWSAQNKPGEQAHWCRGGITFPTKECDRYILYKREETRSKSCLLSNVVIFQDGHIQCSIIDSIGCEECYRRLEQKTEKGE